MDILQNLEINRSNLSPSLNSFSSLLSLTLTSCTIYMTTPTLRLSPLLTRLTLTNLKLMCDDSFDPAEILWRGISSLKRLLNLTLSLTSPFIPISSLSKLITCENGEQRVLSPTAQTAYIDLKLSLDFWENEEDNDGIK